MSNFNPSAAEFVPRFDAPTFMPGAGLPAAPPAESWEDDAVEQVAQQVAAVDIAKPEPSRPAKAAREAAPPKVPASSAQPATAPAPAPEPEEEEEEEEEVIDQSLFHDQRENVNVVFIGHVDAGKSTISGNLLVLTGQVDQRTVAKYEKEAKDKNRESWYLAYIMDTNEEERIKGKTSETGRGQFETKSKRYTILDAPGHKTFVPNMIMGTSQADIGVLVISARKGEFETGFDRGGQTREHALLAKTLGVDKLIVVVNKMDEPSVKWSEERYNEIVTKLTPFMKRCGFQLKKSLWFLPCSGMTGANLVEPVKPDVCPWWKDGYSLISLIDSMPDMTRDPTAPIRIPVSGRYKEMGCTFIMGKIEVGTLTMKSKLCLVPGGQRIELVGILTDDQEMQCCRPGENIILKCRGVEEEDVRSGQVVCPVKHQCKVSNEFVVQMQVTDLLEHKPIIAAGYQAVLHIHSVITECQISKLLFECDSQGRRKKKPPVFVKSHAIVICVITTDYPIAIETFKDRPQLGRLTLRDEGKTIAIGKVLSLTVPTGGASV
ncbi:Eukaryotic peptide chain release factor GTP-binding subunit [Plasmodiophora brassicae]|uniref:Eukaryotic peptide chain release factor GTP-binding subunit n=1 Tax=Plasmodiophora brassicae TaxID=37360 RepID=A0A0G4ILG2_PLABS|nr:hypothetical protein PBRA_004694 [Plasmodiophora brassicae]SPQ93451.1 unnamed protein product [Plasmodiophora brassicae]